jgi:hypothetical protein
MYKGALYLFYTFLNYKRTKESFEEFTVEAADDKLRRYKSNWLRHATRTNSSRMAGIVLNFRPNGGRRFERHLKRILEEAETCQSTYNSKTPQL